MKIFIIFSVFLVGSFGFISNTFADIVVLKSGQEVIGKIIEKNSEYVKVDFQGSQLTYYTSEIEKIKKDAESNEENPPVIVLDQGTTVGPEDVLAQKADAFRADEKYEDGIKYFTQILKKKPNPPPSIYMYLAIFKYHLGKYNEALKDLDILAKFQSDRARMHAYRGLIYRALGKTAEAKESFSQAVERLKYDNGIKAGMEIDLITQGFGI